MVDVELQMINPTLFFRYLEGRCHGNQFSGKNGAKLPTPTPALIALPFRNGMGYHNHNISLRVNSVNDASILYDNVMKFGPVTPELTLLICERQVRHGQKTGVFRRISPDILDRFSQSFAIFSPYENALRTDDGSVPYFLICQGTLPWHPNNFAVIKAN